MEELKRLMHIKSIVTIVVMVTFGILALKGEISPENVVTITATVIAFYFGTQHESKVVGKSAQTETRAEAAPDIQYDIGKEMEQ